MTRARAATPGSPGVVVWITGLPASGKSTLARRIRDLIRRAGGAAVILDGDEVRAVLTPSPGYGAKARASFYATLSGLASLLARQGLAAIVAATAHRRAWRDHARKLAPRFVEVHVAATPAECARRDPKGLWAAASAGQAPHLPGAGEPYEAPHAPEVTARGGRDGAAARRAATLALAGPDARRRATRHP